MSFRQVVLAVFYPFLMWFNRLTGTYLLIRRNEKGVLPNNSIYELSVELNNGKILHLEELKGKKIMLVNTASDCGYTHQYFQLQKLQKQFSSKLAIIAFPSNEFKEQEKENDESIAQFCKIIYSINFPLAKKSIVRNPSGRNQIYDWLSKMEENGWCNQQPTWNFSKYLLNEEGVLTHYFDPGISPIGKKVRGAIEN